MLCQTSPSKSNYDNVNIFNYIITTKTERTIPMMKTFGAILPALGSMEGMAKTLAIWHAKVARTANFAHMIASTCEHKLNIEL